MSDSGGAGASLRARLLGPRISVDLSARGPLHQGRGCGWTKEFRDDECRSWNANQDAGITESLFCPGHADQAG